MNVWIMRREPSGLTPMLERANVDSLQRAWRISE
jgi:hypothetical protein